MSDVEPIEQVLGLWRVRDGENNGYLLVRHRQSLLIDCPAAQIPLPDHLPAPAIILHTQLQEEHCREWAAFPATEVQP